jgi:hypothetical protein
MDAYSRTRNVWVPIGLSIYTVSFERSCGLTYPFMAVLPKHNFGKEIFAQITPKVFRYLGIPHGRRHRVYADSKPDHECITPSHVSTNYISSTPS